jgi:hypothetical protein
VLPQPLAPDEPFPRRDATIQHDTGMRHFGLGIRIQQQFMMIEMLSRCGIIRSVCAKPIVLACLDAFNKGAMNIIDALR